MQSPESNQSQQNPSIHHPLGPRYTDLGRNIPIGDEDDDRPERLARPAAELLPAVADPGGPSSSVSVAGFRGAGARKTSDSERLCGVEPRSPRDCGVSVERSSIPSEYIWRVARGLLEFFLVSLSSIDAT